MKKVCPLMSFSGNSYSQECEEEKCAFWDKDYERCCFLTIAKNLDSVKELSEGQRTLFVREY